MLSWMPMIYIIAAIGVVKIFSWTRSSQWKVEVGSCSCLERAVIHCVFWRSSVDCGEGGPSIPCTESARARPDRILFPHDEFADAGLRPTIFKIAKQARPARCGWRGTARIRLLFSSMPAGGDLHYFSLSDAHWRNATSFNLLVVQDGRNTSKIFLIQELHPKKIPRGLPNRRSSGRHGLQDFGSDGIEKLA